MPSQLRSDTARANGAKPRGPKSAETKEKSSRNSLRHGFTSRHTILLECENEDEFEELEEEFAATTGSCNSGPSPYKMFTSGSPPPAGHACRTRPGQRNGGRPLAHQSHPDY